MVGQSLVPNLRFIYVGFWFVIVRYLVLHNNYVIFLYVLTTSGNYVIVTFRFGLSIYCIFLRQNYIINDFITMTSFSRPWNYVLFVARLYYAQNWRYYYVLFLFVIMKYFLLRHNYFIYLVHVVTFFYDVRITLYVSTFELRIEVTLQLRFVLVRGCKVFFILS